MADAARAPSTRAATTLWLAVLLVPVFVLLVVRWDWVPSATSGDYAQYLSHARALVEGRPYSDIGYIYQPGASLIGPRNYPPGLPVTLAPLVALGGVHSPLVRPLMVACVVLFAALAAWRLAHYVEPWQAALGGALAAYTIEASAKTVAAVSDPGFAVLLWGTVLLVDKDGAWTWRRAAAVTALGFVAMSYRMAGVALVPGLALYALLNRRRLGSLPFLPVLAWAGAGATAFAAGLVRIPFTERFLPASFDLGRHLSTFVGQYKVGLFAAELYPFASNRANDAYHLVASLLVLVGVIVLLRRALRTFMVALIAAYGLMLLIAPVAEPRYAWPFYPIVTTAVVLGTTILVARVTPSWTPRVQRAMTAAPLIGILLVALLTDARSAPLPSLVRHPDARALFTWLVDRSRAARPDAPMRMAFHNPRVLTLETRVAAMGLLPRTAPGQMAALVAAHATHFVWQRDTVAGNDSPGRAPCVQRIANGLPELYPDRFTLEYQNTTFRVYRVHPGTSPITGPSVAINWSTC